MGLWKSITRSKELSMFPLLQVEYQGLLATGCPRSLKKICITGTN